VAASLFDHWRVALDWTANLRSIGKGQICAQGVTLRQ